MARFAAYTSDSSDDEETVPASPVQKDAPMDEDSESESDSSESESESSSESSSLSVDDLRRDDKELPDEQQQNGPVLDKTLIPRAHAIGMDAQRMHVMQSSFFRMPEEAAALNRLNRKHSRDSDGDGLRIDPKQVSIAFYMTHVHSLATLLCTRCRTTAAPTISKVCSCRQLNINVRWPRPCIGRCWSCTRPFIPCRLGSRWCSRSPRFTCWTFRNTVSSP